MTVFILGVPILKVNSIINITSQAQAQPSIKRGQGSNRKSQKLSPFAETTEKKRGGEPIKLELKACQTRVSFLNFVHLVPYVLFADSLFAN